MEPELEVLLPPSPSVEVDIIWTRGGLCWNFVKKVAFWCIKR